jgi:putative colanic acid biosynthesis UDP-glucose lipid carrier transferase
MSSNIVSGWKASHQSHLATFYRLLDGAVIFLSLFFWCHTYDHQLTANWLIVGLSATILFLFYSESLHLYRSWSMDTYSRMLGYTILSWICVCVTLLLIAYFSKLAHTFSRLIIGSWFLSTLVALTFWRYSSRLVLFSLRSRDHNLRSAAIIGVTLPGIQLADDFADNLHFGIRIKGFYHIPESASCQQHLIDTLPYDVLGGLNDAIKSAKAGELAHIYIALPLREEHLLDKILQALADTTATVHVLPNLFFRNLLHSRWYQVGASNVLSIYDTPIEGFYSWLKRAEDLLISTLLLILTSPFMLFIAAAIKLDSKGPVIFKQRRYGLDGRPISVWKFRTMYTLEDGDTVIQARKGDHRVTKVGRFLRYSSMDELPQLINVLQGKMSIVGPRPHAVAHNEEYRKLVDGYMLRHKVKPGITGWAQVNGWRGETDSLEKLQARIECDLYYIRNWSIWLDFRVLCMTLPKVISANNAY